MRHEPETYSSRGYIFMADAHLTKVNEDSELFIEILNKALKERVEVFLLGDIFDLWFGEKKLTYPVQEDVIGKIAKLSARGLKVSYIEGNRDFFIERSWARKHFTHVSTSHIDMTAGSERIFLTHGDTVNREDIFYRFWKKLSKNFFIYKVFSLIPGPVALRLATATERALKKTNPRFRYDFPEEAGRAFAEKRYKEGFHKVIIGHFHREKIIRKNETDGKRMLICLPMWRELNRYFYMDGKGACGFRSFRDNSPLIN